MAFEELEALTFDVFGTVVDWRESIAREARNFLHPRGHDLDWLDFADRWRARYDPSMEPVRAGRRPWVKLDTLHEESLAGLLADCGIRDLAPAELRWLAHAWRRLEPWPDVIGGLARLKPRFILATLSNGNIALMVNMARYAGLPWDAILGAEVAQSYKPQPETYLRSAEALNLDPARCMMVAAHNGDLVAAAACGFRTCYVNRPREYGPKQSRDLGAEHAFDIVAESFPEVADRLGC